MEARRSKKDLLLMFITFIVLFLLHLYIQYLAKDYLLLYSFLAPFTLSGFDSYGAVFSSPLDTPATAFKAAIMWTILTFGIYYKYQASKKGVSMWKSSFHLKK